MRISFTIILFIMVLIVPGAVAQGDLKKQADNLLEQGKYFEARQVFYSYSEDNKEYFFKRGICNYHASHLEDALNDLSLAFEMGIESGELLKYLAFTHHKKGEFYEAARAYKLYLNELKRDDPERKAIVHAIKNCNYGRKAIYREQVGFVENLGQVVNSPYDEIFPVRSPNYEAKYYFSSNRKGSTGGLRNDNGLKDDIYGSYSFDIYAVERINGTWTPASGIPPLLNSARNEFILGFKNEGRELIYLKSGHNQQSQIVSDTFSVDLSSKPIMMITPANGNLGDKDLFFINDSTLLFSSKRKGGYGGYDLYYTTNNGDIWSEPVNMGPEINSPYDEVTPFLTNSGTILYFSSNRKESIGGYDIYFANYGMERGKWLEAENIGIPLSSPGNDKYFSLSEDGRSAIFSSDRAESTGGYDLFIAYIKNQVYEQLSYASSFPFIRKEIESPEDNAQDKIRDNAKSEIPKPQVKTREMVISPLFYGANDVLSNGNNAKALKDILDMMLIFPSMKAVFTGHTHIDGSSAYDLYFSIKRAEQASKYLTSNGISEDRIVIYGAGSNYPMVKSLGTNMAIKNNNRIEIRLTDQSQKGLTTSYTYPVISDYIKDHRAENFRDLMEQLHFRIIVTDAKQMYDDPDILNLDDVIVEKNVRDNSYTYSVGICKKYDKALEIKNNLIRAGYSGVKMKAFKGGYELTASELDVLGNKYQDIMLFLENEFRQ